MSNAQIIDLRLDPTRTVRSPAERKSLQDMDSRGCLSNDPEQPGS
jgi:hypothetical protein